MIAKKYQAWLVGLIMAIMPLSSNAKDSTTADSKTVNQIVDLSVQMADLSVLLNSFIKNFPEKPVSGFLQPNNHPKQTCVNQKLRETSGFRAYQKQQAIQYIHQHGLTKTQQELTLFTPELSEAFAILFYAIDAMVNDKPFSSEQQARMDVLLNNPSVEQNVEKLMENKEYQAIAQLMNLNLLDVGSDKILNQYIQWGLNSCQVNKHDLIPEVRKTIFKD